MDSTRTPRTHFSSPASTGASNTLVGIVLLASILACVAHAAPTRLRPVRPQEPGILAGPPPNDLCSGAIVIPGDGPFPHLTPPVNVFEAGTAGDPPRPSELDPRSLTRSTWYSITPSQDGRYVFSACLEGETVTTLRDSAMAIYTSPNGCAGPFTPVANTIFGCFVNSAGSLLSVDLTAGNQYFLVVWSDTNHPTIASQADLQLRTTREPVAPDTCSIAVPLRLNVPFNGTNLNTGNDYELEPSSACFPASLTPSSAPGEDVVYSFTAPSAGDYAFRLIAASFVPFVIYLSNSCPAPRKGGTEIVDCFAASRTADLTGTEISCVPLTAGQTVYFFVDSALNSSFFRSGNFQVLVEACGESESEANGAPATADPFDCGVMGALGPAATDRDFYLFGTPSSDVRLYALIDASTSGPEKNLDLRVNTTTQTLEFDNRDNGIGPNGSLAGNVAGTRIPAGTQTFLQVDIPQLQGPGDPVEPAGPYRLLAVAQDHADAAPEAEPNDTINTSNSAPSNYFTGRLEIGDSDHYVFQANEGDSLFISLDGSPERQSASVFAEMRLLTGSGERLAITRSGGDPVRNFPPVNSLFATGPNWRSAAMVVRAPYSGFYVVSLKELTGTLAGPYSLSIAKNCQTGGGGVPDCTLTCEPRTVNTTTDPGQCSATVRFDQPGTDGFCGLVTCNPPSGSAFPVGTTVVECTGAGAAACPISVVVSDDEAPAVVCPASVSASITGPACDVEVAFNVTASDNCAGSSVVCSPPTGSAFGPGTTVVTCSATDAAGNSTACSFPVVVADESAPALACPADVTVDAEVALGCDIGANVTFATPPASDNCGIVTVACVPASGSMFPAGTTTVTCTASDAAGNSASCSFLVSVAAPSSVCLRDDASGDTFTQIVDSANPLFGFWRYRKANGTTFCGFAESVSYTPGVRLVSSDRNDPAFRMECNASFSSATSTVQVTELATGKRHTLRDRNINNNPPCQ